MKNAGIPRPGRTITSLANALRTSRHRHKCSSCSKPSPKARPMRTGLQGSMPAQCVAKISSTRKTFSESWLGLPQHLCAEPLSHSGRTLLADNDFFLRRWFEFQQQLSFPIKTAANDGVGVDQVGP